MSITLCFEESPVLGSVALLSTSLPGASQHESFKQTCHALISEVTSEVRLTGLLMLCCKQTVLRQKGLKLEEPTAVIKATTQEAAADPKD